MLDEADQFELVEGPPGPRFQVEIEYNTAVSRQVNNLDEGFAWLAETIFCSWRRRDLCPFCSCFWDFRADWYPKIA